MANSLGFLEASALLILVLINVECNGLSPILVVPGFTGSQLEGKISDKSDCNTKGKWLRYWANIKMNEDCVNKVFTLQYDDSNNQYSNLPGYEVTIPGFGDTDTVEHLDTDHPDLSAYLVEFVDYFVKKGYERGKTIRAAPYDWRFAPDNLNRTGFYQAFKKLVEEMYEDANNEKVSIVVHSMGGPVTLYFFNNIVTQDWKDKYINVYVPLSGAWSGGTGVLINYISKIKSGVERPYGESFQAMESTAWFVPISSIWKDKVVVTTDSKNYTTKDYKELFVDTLNRSVDYRRITNSATIHGNYSAPNVPTHCFYGVGSQTIDVINYGRSLPGQIESVGYGDGDTVINLVASEVCLRWSNQKQPFKVMKFDKVTHGNMVKDNTVLDAVAEAIAGH